MKILVINPNTSAFVTDRVCAAVTACGGVEVTGVTGRRGPPIVGTRAECLMAGQEALELAAEHAPGHDGVLLGISFDSGLDGLREVLDIPVVGMSEAGMAAAMMVSRRFALLSFGTRAGPLYQELIDHYRWGARSAGVIALPPFSQAELQDTTRVLPQLAGAIEDAAATRGAESVVLAGAVFAGMAQALRDRVGIPVIDGVIAATHQLKMLHAMGLRKPQTGSFAFPPAKELAQMPDSLTQMFRGFGKGAST